eukprot:4996314-Prymnesium_polylepis.1
MGARIARNACRSAADDLPSLDSPRSTAATSPRAVPPSSPRARTPSSPRSACSPRPWSSSYRSTLQPGHFEDSPARSVRRHELVT